MFRFALKDPKWKNKQKKTPNAAKKKKKDFTKATWLQSAVFVLTSHDTIE